MPNRYSAYNARRAAAVQSWHEEKARKSVEARRCSRCDEVHEFLFHGYCLACVSDLAGEQARDEEALHLAHQRSIVEADIHAELRCN